MGFEKLKKFILKNTPKKIVNIYQEPIKQENIHLISFSTPSYSQEGEDLILKRIFEGQKIGFYVDVGAHHPQRFSNTYLFYKMGWRGINIDAMPGSMEIFKETRRNDINLEIGVSDKKERLKYYLFNEPALNTFSKHEADKKNGKNNYKVINEVMLETVSLSEILKQYLVNDEKIDFMSIDVEGYDLEVLKSNDWEKYRPVYILVEDLKRYPIDEIPQKSMVYHSLNSKGYKLVAKTFNTLFFKDCVK